MSKLKNALLAAISVLLLSNVLLLVQRSAAQAKNSEDSLSAQVAALKAQVAALQAKTAPLAVSGTDLTITGVNVHIVSGSGATDDQGQLTGLGNLIIGYDARRGPDPLDGQHYSGKTFDRLNNARSGSHNLILGDGNSYSSFGGLVAGRNNTLDGGYASVSGGLENSVLSAYGFIGGGMENTAGGRGASVSGGEGGTAGGYGASVSGGINNAAGGVWASVSGGAGNKAEGTSSAVSGGSVRTVKAGSGWSAGSYHTP